MGGWGKGGTNSSGGEGRSDFFKKANKGGGGERLFGTLEQMKLKVE